MSLLARLDRLPLSRPHWNLMVIGGLGFTFDGADNALVAFLLPSIKAQWEFGNGGLGLLAAATPVGYLFGAAIAGLLGDRVGRKPVMLWALAIYTFFTLVAAMAPGWEVFASARIVAGIGIGAESVIIAPYLSEFIPPKHRGWFVASLAGFFSFGYVIAALIGRFVVPLGENGWRWAQVVTALPIVALLWWRRSLHESPRHLLARGRTADAERVVADFERRVEARGHTLEPVGSVSYDGDLRIERTSVLNTVRALWARGMRRRTAVVWLVWFVNVFTFYGFFTWVPTLLVQRGIEVTRSFDYTLVIYLAMIPGYFSAAALAELLDRKYTLSVYLTAAAASAYWLSQSEEPSRILIAGAVLSWFLNGAFGVIYAYTPELFPTRMRASAAGLASAFGRLGSITAPIVIGFGSAAWGFGGVFGLTTGVLVVGVLGVLIFGPSTSGRSLEDLNESGTPTSTDPAVSGELTVNPSEAR
jgi:putative MFS transporter